MSTDLQKRPDAAPRKYRIYKAMIGWNVVCPCGSWLEKSMTWNGALSLAESLIRGGIC